MNNITDTNQDKAMKALEKELNDLLKPSKYVEWDRDRLIFEYKGYKVEIKLK